MQERHSKISITQIFHMHSTFVHAETLVIGGCGCLFIGCTLMVQCVYNPQTVLYKPFCRMPFDMHTWLTFKSSSPSI